jgi:hypothetical protein
MPPYVPPPEPLPWRVVYCPGEVRFRRVRKESNTLGRIYALFGGDGLLWLGQSPKVLMQFIREYYGLNLHCSSGYRIIRRECSSDRHKGFTVRRPADAEELNRILDLAGPLWLAVVLRDPDKYEMERPSETYAVEKE